MEEQSSPPDSQDSATSGIDPRLMDFLTGIVLAFKSIGGVITNGRTWRNLVGLIIPIALLTLVSWGVLRLIMLPFQFWMYIFGQSEYAKAWENRAVEFAQWMPNASLFFLRFWMWHPLDKLFLSYLNPQDHTSAIVVSQPYLITYKDAFISFLGRTWKRSKMALAVLIVSALPIIGPMTPLMISVYLSARAFGYPFAIALAVLVPHKLSRTPLKTFFAVRALSRELLEFYVGRFPSMTRRTREAESARRAWFTKQGYLALGFALPWFFAVELPWIGPVLYFVATAAVGELVEDINRRNPEEAQRLLAT
ncbi:hypothetical protein BJ742DRAFT_839270 [Cladochytrium replicatum]|nr:hypothetical protein BJ742DRAFT_839270 [Cladochytrium replicatum]